MKLWLIANFYSKRSLTFFLFTVYGRDVKAVIEQPLEAEPMHPGKNTVTYESRLLKGLLLQLI